MKTVRFNQLYAAIHVGLIQMAQAAKVRKITTERSEAATTSIEEITLGRKNSNPDNDSVE